MAGVTASLAVPPFIAAEGEEVCPGPRAVGRLPKESERTGGSGGARPLTVITGLSLGCLTPLLVPIAAAGVVAPPCTLEIGETVQACTTALCGDTRKAAAGLGEIYEGVAWLEDEGVVLTVEAEEEGGTTSLV